MAVVFHLWNEQVCSLGRIYQPWPSGFNEVDGDMTLNQQRVLTAREGKAKVHEVG